ncbi:Fe(3+)-hydroxamate ABC transporter permease FhuB [Labrys wisconsinensis]|uniref:Iron complex transport system permease protein n=1 Tax=Labrys wisconsinensis TaxID=425677 RepID=A0ABU0J1H8_9HYPH|nr:Fe(3+)-hydroxamate ABC transporter permease FhuB [Labrys wisconsinensis]MDQ0468094.1 iron complex transport system permease protein [Labrys wisconsinensis]
MAEMALACRAEPRPRPLWAALAATATLAFALTLVMRPPLPGDPATARALADIVLWQSLLPRAATALLAGAALGLAGALLQRVLRNPIADPSTLGIAAGAQLALTLLALLAPWSAVPREAVAFAGGIGAAALVLGLGWRSGLEPVTVVLSGMVVSLMASSLGAAAVLAHGDYVLSLFIWGAGSLHQQSWDAPLALAVQLALGLLAAGLALRPLALLGLDDASARSLGLGLLAARLAVIAVAVWLAAGVTAEVGIIGFVGLAAPALARLGGARTPRQLLAWAPVHGAALLWLTDGLVQLAGPAGDDLLPTGAATGLLGGPLLLWLLPRLPVGQGLRQRLAPAVSRRLAHPRRAIAVLGLAAALLLALALSLGRDFDGWHLATGPLFAALVPFRLPHLVTAATAGALLGAAGTLMQRLTGNPAAGPEALGVSAGAGVGLAAVLVLAVPTPAAMLAGCTAGAFAALLAGLALAARAGFGPERMLLTGLALGSLGLAVLTAVLASGEPGAFLLLVWMSGSTDNAAPEIAAAVLVAAVLLVGPAPLLARWIDILPLGEAAGRALGLPLRASRLALALLAALMTGAASLAVGPLSLVGLIGPHLARLLGFARGAHQLLAAALIGGGVMMLVDWLGRMVVFPYQIPAGLLAALVGGAYLAGLLARGEAGRT